jgi:hypothetical protein
MLAPTLHSAIAPFRPEAALKIKCANKGKNYYQESVSFRF